MDRNETDFEAPSDPPSPSIARLSHSDAPVSFGDVVRLGWRTANATWIAAVLIMLIQAPPTAVGVVAAMAAMNGDLQFDPMNGPSWQIYALMILSIGIFFWMLVMLFALPWVHGAAAARIRESIASPEHRHMSFVDAGNRVFSRVLVLSIIHWLMVAACAAPAFLVTIMLMRDKGFMTFENPQTSLTFATHPAMLVANVFTAMGGIVIAFLWNLCVAAIVCEDQGIVGAIERGFNFLPAFRRDAWRLLLLSAAITLPPFLLQEAMTFFDFNWVFAAVAIIAVAYTAYTQFALMAVTIALYHDRRCRDAWRPV